MQLTEAPVTNSYHYQQIPIKSRCPGCGASPPCGYNASVTLDDGLTGSYFDGPITSTDSVSCPLPILISASGSTELSITFQDAHTRDMIYTGTPTFDVVTSSGQQTLTLSAFTSHLSFTHSDQFPCYQFQGNSFAPC